MVKRTSYFLGLGIIILLGFFFPSYISAYQIQNLEFTGPPEGDFVLGPGKVELWMDPGQTITKELYVTNRIGKRMDFKLEIEDFRGSRDTEKAVVLLGEEKGPYSLKDYVHPEEMRFALNHGERIILPVKISIPEDAEPGGLYGAVLVTSEPPKNELKKETQKAVPQVRIISRLGALFFVRVKGEVKNNGFLKNFTSDKRFYEKGPISFELLSENNGSIHLIPYGIIKIKNIFGKEIEEIKLDPWFVMPDSLRSRKIEWKRNLLFGRYTAAAEINRGYKNIVDEKIISFWVIPWKIISVIFIVLAALIWFIIWALSHFEVRRKKPEDSFNSNSL